jgi:tyrosyl-tRNA synthetase
MDNIINYINSLKEVQNLEIINLESLNKDISLSYCGYQISGIPHIGSWIYFLFLDYISRHFKINTCILLADIHTKLNNKLQKFDIKKEFIRTFPDTKVKFILGSEFQASEKYINMLLDYSKTPSIKRIYKSLDIPSRSKSHYNKLNILLYPILQVLDIQYLSADLIISGMDQRRIHMLNLDTTNRKPCFIHFPIISGIGTKIKMSKSLNNSINLGCTYQEFKDKWDKLNKNSKELFIKLLILIRPDFKYQDLLSKIYV